MYASEGCPPFCLLRNSQEKLFTPLLRSGGRGGGCGVRMLNTSPRFSPVKCPRVLCLDIPLGAGSAGTFTELLRGQVFWCYQEGLITPRESIPNDFNGTGSGTAL